MNEMRSSLQAQIGSLSDESLKSLFAEELHRRNTAVVFSTIVDLPPTETLQHELDPGALRLLEKHYPEARFHHRIVEGRFVYRVCIHNARTCAHTLRAIEVWDPSDAPSPRTVVFACERCNTIDELNGE